MKLCVFYLFTDQLSTMSRSDSREKDGRTPGSDIESIVLRRSHLIGLLFPAFALYDGVMYVAR